MWGEEASEDYFTFSPRRLEEEEEEEIFYGGKFRLGQLFDRLIGWSVFGDDGDSSEEEEEEEQEQQERRGRREQRVELQPELPEDDESRRKRRDLDEGWQDPAWFFSIASNVLF
jgi:hypothetical protein